MNVVLVEPEIAPNTGNVARLCAVTRSRLHLIEPLGFKLDERQLKRAAMDYWGHLEWYRWPNWSDFQCRLPASARFWLIESGGPRHYAEVTYGPDDYLVYGRESAGLPTAILERHREHWVRIPMFHEQTRSLNLGNSVAVVLYEALRQAGFPGEIRG